MGASAPAHHGSLGVPEDEAWPRSLADAEQAQLLAQLPVIPAQHPPSWQAALDGADRQPQAGLCLGSCWHCSALGSLQPSTQPGAHASSACSEACSEVTDGSATRQA